MLHLLPVKIILQIAVALVALAVLAAVNAGWLAAGDFEWESLLLVRWSPVAASAMVIALFAAWRWIPPAQRFIFPYLGGDWRGFILFEGRDGEERRAVKLEVKHTLFGLKLMLESNESTSSTLAVHAERNRDFARFRLYYVYLNERKDGVLGAHERYRGIAIMRVEPGHPSRLRGTYFTEANRSGILELSARRLHPWWKLWR